MVASENAMLSIRFAVKHRKTQWALRNYLTFDLINQISFSTQSGRKLPSDALTSLYPLGYISCGNFAPRLVLNHRHHSENIKLYSYKNIPRLKVWAQTWRKKNIKISSELTSCSQGWNMPGEWCQNYSLWCIDPLRRKSIAQYRPCKMAFFNRILQRKIPAPFSVKWII